MPPPTRSGRSAAEIVLKRRERRRRRRKYCNLPGARVGEIEIFCGIQTGGKYQKECCLDWLSIMQWTVLKEYFIEPLFKSLLEIFRESEISKLVNVYLLITKKKIPSGKVAKIRVSHAEKKLPGNLKKRKKNTGPTAGWRRGRYNAYFRGFSFRIYDSFKRIGAR